MSAHARGILALLVFAAGVFALHEASAQSAKKVWTVGILWHAAGPEQEEIMFRPFVEGMRELGYVEGRNLRIEQTYADERFERFAAQARELVERRKVDIILASIGQAAVAARSVSPKIPIVFATTGDPVKLGLVESLRRPGGTVTGLSTFFPELGIKHLEMLKEIVPGITRVAILWNPTNQDSNSALREAERGAQRLNLQLVPIGAKGPEEFEAAFAAIATAKVGGLIVLGDPMLRVNSKSIVSLVATSKLPAVYGPRDYVEAGGLISYGINVPMNFKRSAAFIDRILRGASPSEIPVEQPTTLELVVNLKSARALGIGLPPGILARAGEVIR